MKIAIWSSNGKTYLKFTNWNFLLFQFCHNRTKHFWYITLGHQHYWKIQIVYLALVLRKFRRNSVSTMPNHSLGWVNYRVSHSWGDHYTQLLAFEKYCPVTIFWLFMLFIAKAKQTNLPSYSWYHTIGKKAKTIRWKCLQGLNGWLRVFSAISEGKPQ